MQAVVSGHSKERSLLFRLDTFFAHVLRFLMLCLAICLIDSYFGACLDKGTTWR